MEQPEGCFEQLMAAAPSYRLKLLTKYIIPLKQFHNMILAYLTVIFIVLLLNAHKECNTNVFVAYEEDLRP